MLQLWFSKICVKPHHCHLARHIGRCDFHLHPILRYSPSRLFLEVHYWCEYLLWVMYFLFVMDLPSRKVDRHTRGRMSWRPASMGRWSVGYLHEVPMVSSCNQGQLPGFPVSNGELRWRRDYWIWYPLDYLYGMVKQRRSMFPVPKTYTKARKPPTAITTASGTTQLPVSDTRPINAKPSSEEPDYTNP